MAKRVRRSRHRRDASPGAKSRFSLWLADESICMLKRQQRASGKGSLADVIREAVEVYRSLLQAKEAGLQLYFHDTVTGERGRIWLLPGPLFSTGRIARSIGSH